MLFVIVLRTFVNLLLRTFVSLGCLFRFHRAFENGVSNRRRRRGLDRVDLHSFGSIGHGGNRFDYLGSIGLGRLGRVDASCTTTTTPRKEGTGLVVRVEHGFGRGAAATGNGVSRFGVSTSLARQKPQDGDHEPETTRHNGQGRFILPRTTSRVTLLANLGREEQQGEQTEDATNHRGVDNEYPKVSPESGASCGPHEHHSNCAKDRGNDTKGACCSLGSAELLFDIVPESTNGFPKVEPGTRFVIGLREAGYFVVQRAQVDEEICFRVSVRNWAHVRIHVQALDALIVHERSLVGRELIGAGVPVVDDENRLAGSGNPGEQSRAATRASRVGLKVGSGKIFIALQTVGNDALGGRAVVRIACEREVDAGVEALVARLKDIVHPHGGTGLFVVVMRRN